MINELFPDYSNTPKKHKNFNYTAGVGKDTGNLHPAVSIITSLFNADAGFYETITCILAQSFQNFEWIIINDGSSNPVTIDLLSKVEKIDRKIKIINHDRNKGTAAGRNTGIASAKGNYIFFIDSADLIELTTVEKFYNFLKFNKEYDFVNSYVVVHGQLNYLSTGDFTQSDKLFDENLLSATFMARKEVFSLILFDEKLKEGFSDWDFWFNAAINGKWGYTIHEYLCWYGKSQPGSGKWKNSDSGEETEAFKKRLKASYLSAIEDNGFPVKYPDRYKKDIADDDPQYDYTLEKKKKRILFVLPWFNMGGADKFNQDLLKGLVENFEWEATIVSTLSSKNEWLPKFAEVTPDIFNLPNYLPSYNYYKYFDYIIRTRKPDVIFITHSQFGYWICPYLKQRYPQIPIVDYLHVEDPAWEDGWGYLRMSSLVSNALDKTFVSSNMLKSWLKTTHQRNPENIEVCYTNIDTELWKHNPENKEKIRNEWNLKNDLPVIMFAGRIDQQKQPLVIINSIKHLLKKTQSFRFILIGDGPDFNKMKQEIIDCGLENNDRIKCLGSMKNEEVKKYMDASDIFFLPSEYEGISLAIYEAMAKGLAIVASDVGGQNELVTTDCGVLLKRSTPENESEQYGELLYQLISNTERLNAMKKASRERVAKHFEINKMHAQINSALTTNLETKSHYDLSFEYRTLLSHYLVSEAYNQKSFNSSDPTNETGRSIFEVNYEISSKFSEVKAWYEKEYESLPLWYKRFGHLLKVMQGKRSFKSLFEKKNKPV